MVLRTASCHLVALLLIEPLLVYSDKVLRRAQRRTILSHSTLSDATSLLIQTSEHVSCGCGVVTEYTRLPIKFIYSTLARHLLLISTASDSNHRHYSTLASELMDFQ